MHRIAPIVLGILTLAAPAAATDAPLDQLVPGAIAFHNEVAGSDLAALSSTDLQELLAGEIVITRRRGRTESGHAVEGVYAYALAEQPREHLWLAATRPGFGTSKSLTALGLERHDDGRTLTFMHLDLPWPIGDRWWLASVAMDVGVAEASEGRIWARRWRMAEDGISRVRARAREGELGAFTAADLEEGLPLLANEGAFLVFDLDGRHSLIAYASRIAAGGDMPPDVFTDFSCEMTRTNLTKIVAEAKTMPTLYTARVPRCVDGFGRPMPYFQNTAGVSEAVAGER